MSLGYRRGGGLRGCPTFTHADPQLPWRAPQVMSPTHGQRPFCHLLRRGRLRQDVQYVSYCGVNLQCCLESKNTKPKRFDQGPSNCKWSIIRPLEGKTTARMRLTFFDWFRSFQNFLEYSMQTHQTRPLLLNWRSVNILTSASHDPLLHTVPEALPTRDGRYRASRNCRDRELCIRLLCMLPALLLVGNSSWP
jgi:hypothetical protein